MNPSELRRIILEGLLEDDVLLEVLVLKGGNALELVYELIDRGSVDLDFSIDGDFADLVAIEGRVLDALARRLDRAGLALLDASMRQLPPPDAGPPIPWWGGYRVTFKVIRKELLVAHQHSIEKLRFNSVPVDSLQGRTFIIDISKHEYCRDKVRKPIGHGEIFVYTEEMCVVEKFRAICQQHPQYTAIVHRSARARARDFFDIYAVVTKLSINLQLPENLELFRAIFATKHVPLELLAKIGETRETHRSDWDRLASASPPPAHDYDFYFDFVADEARRLQVLWNE